MKIKIAMKTPDALHDSVFEALNEPKPENVEIDEWIADQREREGVVKDKLAKWFRYGECLTVEYDADADTLVVVPNK